MAVSNLDFSAAVGDWAKQSEDRMERIFKASTQELASIAINGTPIDTGFARASWRASTESMPQIEAGSKGQKGKVYPSNFGEISTVIAGAMVPSTLYLGMTAVYGLALEYGHSQQAPAGFVRIAAAQWPSIVSGVVADAKSRVG